MDKYSKKRLNHNSPDDDNSESTDMPTLVHLDNQLPGYQISMNNGATHQKYDISQQNNNVVINFNLVPSSPHTPKNSRIISKLDASSISPQAKENFTQKLQSIEHSILQEVLVAAALNECIFPAPLEKKLEPLKKAYKVHQANPSVRVLIETAINTYIKTEGLSEFCSYLNIPFNDNEWKSGLLNFLGQSSLIPSF